jgi:hypothetical protein
VIFRISLTGLSLGESDLTVTSLSIFRRGGSIPASSEPGIIRVSEGAGEVPTMTLSRRLTIRSGPGPEFDPVGAAEPNVELQVLGISEDGAWYLIALPDQTQGWIAASRFITFEGDITLLEIITEPLELATAPPTATTPPTDTSTPTETPAPEATEAQIEVTAPVETAEATAVPAVTDTPAPLVPTDTPSEPTKTELPTEVPPTLVPADTPLPTETPLPTDTTQPTATLRTNTEQGTEPATSKTPGAADTPTVVPTDTPLPTETPLPTDTPTALPTATLLPTNTPAPCTVTTTNTNVAVYVGPNRSVRATFPVNQVILVRGQQQANDGSLWWQIEPLGGSVEVDRFWVRQSDVTAQGGCDVIGSAESPQVIGGGGGGGNQFSGTFRGGQNSINHTFRIGTAGTYAITCSGSPVYPEFGVGSSRSRGQTTLTLPFTTGNYTLTVFASTFNASGQPVSIASYNCALSRR